VAQVLYTSNDIRKCVAELFRSSKSRRVAISAFVGEGADAYLPNPDGLELICWPKPGGTNPNALRRLMKKGVIVWFADSLHMKVYWTKDLGSVISSANLSRNALGSGNLREVGIRLPPGGIDIERLISSVKRYPATKAHLLKLDRQHKLFAARNPGFNRNSKADSWQDWYFSKYRVQWKLGWWDTESSVSKTAKEISEKEFGISDPHDFIAGQIGDYSQGDCILTFFLDNERPTNFKWLHANFNIRVPRSERKGDDQSYPFQAVQVHSQAAYSAPPFSIDNRFRVAFSKAIKVFGAETVKSWKSAKPSQRFINEIQSHYKANKRVSSGSHRG
jgi:hypothetical protein